MSWTTPTTRAFNDLITAGIWNTDLVNNLIELRGGGIAISGQAANRIPYASGTTQLTTSSNLTFDGTTLASLRLSAGTSPAGISNGEISTAVSATNGTIWFGSDANVYLYRVSGLVTLTGANLSAPSLKVTGTVTTPGSLSFGGNTLIFQCGTNGYQWANSSNSVALATLSDAGAFIINGDATFSTTSNFSWVTKAITTVYQAASDGLVLFSCGLEAANSLTILSDASNPPTTSRATTNVHAGGVDVWSQMLVAPVRKGDYWKCVTSGSALLVNYVFWVPLGFNG